MADGDSMVFWRLDNAAFKWTFQVGATVIYTAPSSGRRYFDFYYDASDGNLHFGRTIALQTPQ
jgi:hypothetical protein